WQISAEQVPWVPEPDPAKASKIEVRFIPEDSTTTTVELIHHDFDRHGKSGPDMHAAMNSEQGWSHLLKCYAEVVK
ncbi:MAG: ATPase, partial [Phycisphaerae bacterium]|nr:ATPase [Phycisphaerae bacterium]